jgi:hypothetical protein
VSIKVLADRKFAFDRGEKDKSGQLIREFAAIGFNTLPDWVAETDLYKDATQHGLLHPFESSRESESVQKESEKLAKLRQEVAILEEQKALLQNDPAPVESKPKKSRADKYVE